MQRPMMDLMDPRVADLIADCEAGMKRLLDGADSDVFFYAANGHGGNVELRNIDQKSFRFSLPRVFDSATPTHSIDAAESQFKSALDTLRHGLNRN